MNLKKYIAFSFLLLCLFCFFPMGFASAKEWSQQDPLVLVIDPGHGGENEGTTEGLFVEKDMTMRTATKLYDLLSEYDHVKVYLTHTEDSDYSLKERAQFAKNVDADYLISIHYNASVRHDLFGSEVWIQSEDKLNKQDYGLAYCFLEAFRENGQFIRGIKIKYNDSGKDYYGILRESTSLGIPAMIVEHCHVDEARDIPFQDTEEKQLTLAQLDANAIARYFQLTKNGEAPEYDPVPIGMAQTDDTPPEQCEIELISENRDDFTLTVKVFGTDFSSCLLYYDYSLDGGETFSELLEWPGANALSLSYDESFLVDITIPEGVRPDVVFRAYNLYDNSTTSNMLRITKAFTAIVLETEEIAVDDNGPSKNSFYEEPSLIGDGDPKQDYRIQFFLIFSGILLFIMLNVALLSMCYVNHKNKRRRKRKK